MATWLVVCKDAGSFHYLAPLILSARSQGIEIVLVAEGISIGLFKERGIMPDIEGAEDFQLELSSINVREVLEEVSPDVVITGISLPMNLENLFAVEAKHLDIPLVCIEDNWGTYIRLAAEPDLILTIDTYAQKLIERHTHSKSAVVGNYGVSAARSLSIEPNVAKWIEGLKQQFDIVCLYVGGGLYTTEGLQLLIQCIEITGARICVIPRFHPQFAGLSANDWEEGATLSQQWSRILSSLGECVAEADPAWSVESLVLSSDVTISGSSSLLTMAVAAGKKTVSVWTPETQKHYEENTSISGLPLVVSGFIHSVRKPTDLSTVLSEPVRTPSDLEGYDPEKAFEAIRELTCRELV